MDPEYAFLLQLAMKYLSFSLYDQVLEVLGQIPEDATEAHQTAQLLTLHTHLLRRDFDRAISLGEGLGGAANLPPLAAQDLATAYWNTGARDQAREALMIGNWAVPAIYEVQEVLAGIPQKEVKSAPAGIEEVLDKASRLNLGYHFALENIASLIWDSRPASSCFDTQVPFLVQAQAMQPREAKRGHFAVATVLYLEFQIYTAYLPYFTPASQDIPGIPYVKLYLSRNPDLFSRVQEMEDIYWQHASPQPEDPAWQTYLEKEATLLGHPECCAQRNIELFSQGVEFKAAALADLVRENLRSEFKPDLPSPHYAYFTFRFLPCSPRCSAAEALGHHLADCYQKASALMYQLYTRMILPLNQGVIYRHGMPYQKFIQGFDETLEARLGDFGKHLAENRTGSKKEESSPEN
jgi:hypothetical protein